MVTEAVVLAPSDVKENTPSPFVVAGRVLSVSPQRLVLADAFCALEMDTSSPISAAAGHLLTCSVERHDGDNLLVREVLDLIACPEPRGDGEFARLSTGGRAASVRARSEALRVIRHYFEEQRFIETETPTFVPCPGLDPHVHSLASVVRDARTDHLITSPELHMKRLLVAGFPRVYQCARCFRAEEQGSQHEPEFTLVEWYRAFSGWERIARDTEEIVVRVISALSPLRQKPLQLPQPFHRLTVREAFLRFAQVPDAALLACQNEAEFFEILVTRVEPELRKMGAVFLTHYPLSMAALARVSPHDDTVAERFELYVDGIELSNGYGELTSEPLQRARFVAEQNRRAANSETVYPLDERFLTALVEGMPPSGGNALGLERLVALAVGSPEIGSALAFTDSER